MKWFILVVSMASFTVADSQSAPFFAEYPAPSPDGNYLVFSYQDDLWKISVQGGEAVRLTAMPGKETRPRFSPDGKWIAFSARPTGNDDLYVMPSSGGEIRQLTYHTAADEVESWSWDNASIYFTSTRSNRITAYRVSLQGGTPERLYANYFNTIHNICFHPKTGAMWFNESWESSAFEHRKGYKGAHNPDLKSYQPDTRNYQEHTDWEGKDFGTTIDRNGSIYFVSDRDNGEYNIYQLQANDAVKRLTRDGSSWYHIQVSANGQIIAGEKDYQLWIYDVASGRARKLAFNLPQYSELEQPQDFKVQNRISDFDVSPDNKKIAFVSRGELFVSDNKGKFVVQLKTAVDGRVSEVHWLKDSRTILFNQTVAGYQNWFTLPADGSAQATQITRDVNNNQTLTFNSDRTKAVYFSGRDELRELDLATMKSTLLVRDEFWELYQSPAHYSPDDQWILFEAYRNFERDLFVYQVSDKSVRNLTNTAVTETGGYWSPDGKYIYYYGNPFKPAYPYGLDDPDLFRMPLVKIQEPFSSDKNRDLFLPDSLQKKDTGKPVVVIDNVDLMERVEPIGPTFGSQGSPMVFRDKDKTTVLFVSNQSEGDASIWKMVMEPFEKTKTEKIDGANTFGLDVRRVKDDYYALIRGNLFTLDLGGNKTKKLDIDYTFQRNLAGEFRQMFFETWANLEQNYYDENFHGKDWPGLRDKYAAFLPYVNTRGDLRRLINDLLGELNTSHFGFSSFGDEEDTYYETSTMATGIEFSQTDPYVVERIVRNSPADGLAAPLQSGDRLIAIDGNAINASHNRESYFVRPSLPDECSLTFLRGHDTIQVKLDPVNYFSIRNELYDEWIENNQHRVDMESKKRIAYVYMKNMGGGELEKFMKDMVSEGAHRDALILDLRYNTGGNVHDDVLRFLSQKPYLQWKYRGGQLTQQSNFAPAAKPMVLLVNQQSLSDAEMTSAGFKQLGLGKIIGTETYRWIIFTSGKGLVDGSFYRLPSWGCYTMDGKDLEKTGVAPDIYVRNTFVDRVEGKDPQLDRAIEEVMKQLGN